MHWRWLLILSYYYKYKEGSHYMHVAEGWITGLFPGGQFIFSYAQDSAYPQQIKGSM